MSGLDPEELEAIQNVVREANATPARAGVNLEEGVASLSVIADDRAAQVARPWAQTLAIRWNERVRLQLRHVLPPEAEFNLVSSEIIDGTALRDELAKTWMCCISPLGRPGPALLSIRGSLVEAAAAHTLGDRQGGEVPDRPPSHIALRVFEPVGRTIAVALTTAWQEIAGQQVTSDVSEAKVDEAQDLILNSEVVIAATIAVSGWATGLIRLIARPTTLIAPPAPIASVPAPPGAVEAALGAVPVDLRVVLATRAITMSQLEKIEVGTVIQFPQFIDALLPIECAGVVKAYGRATVTRGVLAVEIDTKQKESEAS